MKSLTTPDFWHSFATLPSKVKEQAKKAYQLRLSNEFHPSLHFKKVSNDLWSVRINIDDRALAVKEGEDYYWIWIRIA